MLTKLETSTGRGAWAESRVAASTMWLAASGLTVIGLVSGWSLVNYSDSVVQAVFSQDGFQ